MNIIMNISFFNKEILIEIVTGFNKHFLLFEAHTNIKGSVLKKTSFS